MNTSSPRTLVVDLAHGFGGASARTIGLIKNYPAGEIALASLAGSWVTKKAQALGLPVYIVGKHKADPRIPFQLAKVIRQNKFQVLDTQNIQSKLWASIAATMTSTALVSTLNSWYRSEHGNGSMRGKLYTRLELITNWRLNRYVTVSKTVRRSMIEAGISAGKIDLIYNAVNIDPASIQENRAELCKQYNLPSDATICVAVGRLVWAKGYADLIEALALVVQRNPQVYCLIVGDGTLKEELTTQIARHKLQQNIRLLGFQERERVLSIVKASDIFVMSSKQEGTPVALLEAGALGKPILATSTGGIPELVKDGVQARLVPVGNTSALADALLELTQKPELRKYLGEQARQRVAENFSLNTQVKYTQRTYIAAWKDHNNGSSLNDPTSIGPATQNQDI